MKHSDINHLEWVYERMKYVHNENCNFDYMIKFRKIIDENKVTVKKDQCHHPFPYRVAKSVYMWYVCLKMCSKTR